MKNLNTYILEKFSNIDINDIVNTLSEYGLVSDTKPKDFKKTSKILFYGIDGLDLLDEIVDELRSGMGNEYIKITSGGTASGDYWMEIHFKDSNTADDFFVKYF